MPDRADVEQSLAAALSGIIYPTGVGSDSIAGTLCKVYRGWPVAGALETDLAQGIVHVTVQPVSGSTRDRTRYSQEWQGSAPAPSLFATVSGMVVTFSGDGGPGHVAGIRVDNVGYAYRMRDGDTCALVAAALAAQIRADRPALATDASVFLLNGRGILARVVTDGIGGEELRRQAALFRVTCWCPDPSTRDALVAQVDVALAGSVFLDVGGWACRLQIAGDSSSDEGSAAGIWRRDLLYTVEYPTVAVSSLPAMLFGVADVNTAEYIG